VSLCGCSVDRRAAKPADHCGYRDGSQRLTAGPAWRPLFCEFGGHCTNVQGEGVN